MINLRLLRYLRLHKRPSIIIVTIVIAIILSYKISPFHLLQSSKINEDYDPFGFTKGSHIYQSQQQFPAQKPHLDLHFESGSVIDSHHDEVQAKEGTQIAIGLAITSKGIESLTEDQVRYKFPFFRSLLPSVCKTSTQGYHYHFYIAYDIDDTFFTNATRLGWFADTFYHMKEEMCSFVTGLWLHLIRCKHGHKPAWAQNDAMYEAYLDHRDYYYRVNDDTYLKTPGWTERFTSALLNFSPPNVGVVGPKHENGKVDILTFDFVHRTHLDVFGFYYPRSFTDWWGDDWITAVYQPGRSIKIMDSKVLHTQQLGTRYTNQFGRVQFLKAEIENGKRAVQRYIASLYNVSESHPPATTNVSLRHERQIKDTPKVKLKEVKVIAMSLWGHAVARTYGAIRNVNLAKIFFPGWAIRIYAENSIAGTTVHEPVPKRILQKLQYLGAEVHFIPAKDATLIQPALWHYLVADDAEVERFVIRNPDSRLSDRDFRTMSLWEQSSASFHCIRDHHHHAKLQMVDGLWGGWRSDIPKSLNRTIRQELIDFSHDTDRGLNQNNLSIAQIFLQEVLWEKLQRTILCHDSVSCHKWRNSVRLPWKRQGQEYIGQRFDAWGAAEMMNHTFSDTGNLESCEGNE